jgi:hypothetical protein
MHDATGDEKSKYKGEERLLLAGEDGAARGGIFFGHGG